MNFQQDDWDEEKILKVKKILFDKWQKICFNLSPHTPAAPTNINNQIEWKKWLADNGIKKYKELWICIQFLDSNHIMVDISPKSHPHAGDDYKLFLLVPKDFAKKLIVLSTFED
jgi:hypothetical protein